MMWIQVFLYFSVCTYVYEEMALSIFSSFVHDVVSVGVSIRTYVVGVSIIKWVCPHIRM